ncbi:hypothetical protein [Saccharococcus sp. Marseille-Q5394]|uniref:hypothetical protein n=1 Tax=Saccharococcus sp. Marseille-Q5394 TaxID=2972778 RepID=UPI0021C77231|nr:hypothetical protein [Saccharococcus sp. Marseille-Q5394]
MGLICSCGAIVTGTDPEVPIDFVNERATGQISFTANICRDRLEQSSLQVVFVDNEPIPNNNSFVFTSIPGQISVVICEPLEPQGGCRIVVLGMGLVTGEVTPRNFTIIFQDSGGLNDDFALIQEINGFVLQAQSAELPPGSVTVLGCTPD